MARDQEQRQGQGQQGSMIRLCGLWLQTSQGGRKYFSGRIGTAKLMVFRNTKKKKDTDPDFTVCMAPWEQRDGDTRREPGDDEVPF